VIPVAYRQPIVDTLRDWRERMQERGVSEDDCRMILASVLVGAIPRFLPAVTPDMAVALANNALDELDGKPVADTTPADPAVGLLPKPAALCEPERGEECPVPFGKDIRALAWAGRDWTFVGCEEWMRSLNKQGNTITVAPDWERNGIRYVCAGHREPSSNGPLIETLSGEYRETMRWYYWPTREQAR